MGRDALSEAFATQRFVRSDVRGRFRVPVPFPYSRYHVVAKVHGPGGPWGTVAEHPALVGDGPPPEVELVVNVAPVMVDVKAARDGR